jgi:hypothetical protein
MERSSVFTATPRLGTGHRGTHRPAHAAGLTTGPLDAVQAVAIGVAAMLNQSPPRQTPPIVALTPLGLHRLLPGVGLFLYAA